jgi:L-threonylcarbamoyladenylate synthase
MSTDRNTQTHLTTRRYALDQLQEAAAALRAGKVVAFPTETVYGLGASACDSTAIARVFDAKGRPQDNPLIVHIADLEMLTRVVRSVPDIAQRCIDAFWPGPLTLLFPKSETLPSSVTAMLDTVAVRMPSEPVAFELIRLAGIPLVAPSANRSGRPSATTWQAVAEDLDGRIDGIVCGNPSRIGLESTVLDIVHSPPRILRHGGISMATIQAILPDVVDSSEWKGADSTCAAPSPGMKHRHYQPKARVVIRHSQSVDAHLSQDELRDEPIEIPRTSKRGWLGIHSPPTSVEYTKAVVFQSLDEYAAGLFHAFREMDHLGIEWIECEAVPMDGIGRAIMDRLNRASSRS